MDLNVISPINQLGYGIAGLNIVKSLSELEHEISLFIIGQPEAGPEHANMLKSCINKAGVPNFSAPCIRIWHQHDMAQFATSTKRIGFPIFELDTFNDVELHNLKSVDELFVCSEWAKNVIKENNINIPTTVIPLGVDSNIFKPVESFKKEKTIFFTLSGRL